MISSKSLEHSIFQWDINNFLLCIAEPSYFFVSPVFDLVYSSSKWYLEIYILKFGDSENTRVNLSIRLCRAVTDEGPTEIKVRFSLTIFSTDGTVFGEANNRLCTFRKASTCGIDFEATAKFLASHLKGKNKLIITCQIFATADSSEIWSSGFNQTDLDTLSKDLSLLVFSSDIPTNAALISEGDEITVHKEILCARSAVFVDLFAKSNFKVEVPYSKEAVHAMLIFLYSGDVGMMALNSPPPIELCDLAHEYNIPHLQNVLCPQKAEASTTIQSFNESKRWNIPNFTATWSRENTPVDFKFKDIQVKITLMCYTDNRRGKLEFFVQLWNPLQVRGSTIDMYILDVFGNERVTQNTIRSSTNTGTDSFSFFIEGELVFGQEHIILPHDILFTDFCFNFNTGQGELSSLPVITAERTNSSGTFASHSLSNQLKDLFITKLFADVNIRVGNLNIPAHKSILSARSSAFNDIFRKTQMYEITGLSVCVVQQLLYYIYTGYIYIADTLLLIELYNAADLFSVTQLKVACYKLLSKCRITATNVCALLHFSCRQNLNVLKTRCIDDICKHADVVIDKPSWANLKSENPELCAEILDMILNKSQQFR